MCLDLGTGGGEAEPAAVLALAALVAGVVFVFSLRGGYAKLTPGECHRKWSKKKNKNNNNTKKVEMSVTRALLIGELRTIHAQNAAMYRPRIGKVQHNFRFVNDLGVKEMRATRVVGKKEKNNNFLT